MYRFTHGPNHQLIAPSIDGFLVATPFGFAPNTGGLVLKPDQSIALVSFASKRSQAAQFPQLSAGIPLGQVSFRIEDAQGVVLLLRDFRAEEAIADEMVDAGSTVSVLTGTPTTTCCVTYTYRNAFHFQDIIADGPNRYYWKADLAFGTDTAPLSYRRVGYDFSTSNYHRLFAFGPPCQGGGSIFNFVTGAGANMHQADGAVAHTVTNPLAAITFTDRRRGDQNVQFFGAGAQQTLGASGAVFVVGGSFSEFSAIALQSLVDATITGGGARALAQLLEQQEMPLLSKSVSSTVFQAIPVDVNAAAPSLFEGILLRDLSRRVAPVVFL